MNSTKTHNQLSSKPIVVVENWCHTRSAIIQCNYAWTIDNFHLLQLKTGQWLKSSIFSAGSYHNSKWSLRIFPNGLCEEAKDFVSIHLILESSNNSEVLAKFNISILNSKGKKQKGDLWEIKYFSPSKGWGHNKFASRGYLLHKGHDVLPENKLTIYCEVHVMSATIRHSSGQKNVKLFKIPEKSSLAEDMNELLDSENFSDVTLVTGHYEFPVHKNILAARSFVFSDMFADETEVEPLKKIIVTDVDHKVLQEMINFIYTGEAPNVADMAGDLLVAADKYELYQLNELCQEALFSGLSIETAADTLVLADLHNAHRLKRATINFINSHAQDIVKTNEWKNLAASHPSLIAEAFQALFTRNSNDQQ